MPIQTQDIVIYQADNMTDADEGGGAITGNVVIDGESNNIFEDISTLDRVYGAVHMRKVFPAVHTQTVDNFFGSHAIISRLPGDSKIGVNLFTTHDWFDRRADAQFRVENYRIQGGSYLGFLLGTQYAGSKVVTIFQGEDKPIPGVGEVLYLTQNGDTENQYIRISRIDESVQEFSDGSGVYRRRILNLEISQPLMYDFIGADISRSDNLSPDATIKTTVVPNAARYYSTRPLLVAAEPGDLSVRVDGIYSQIVPSSTAESAITDADANGYVATLTESADNSVSFNVSDNFSAGGRLYLGRPCEPGSLSIDAGSATLIDDAGRIKAGSSVVGTIDYAEGTLLWAPDAPTYSGTKTVTFRPAAAPVTIADTALLPVTEDNRGYVWTYTITPAPRPGSVRLSYMALGNWYTLSDDTSGALSADDDGIGVGTIDYTTGTVSVTLGALPDVDSAILLTWGIDGRYFNRASITPDPLVIRHQLAHAGVAPQTLTITWNDGQSRSMTADQFGVLSGDGSGKLNHTTGEVEFSPDTLPLGGGTFEFSYQYGNPKTVIFNQPFLDGNGELSLNIGETNLLPHTIEVEWNVLVEIDPEATRAGYQSSHLRVYTAEDDGAGALTDVSGSAVDYANGTITFNPERQAVVPKPVKSWVATGQMYQANPPFGKWRSVMSLRITGFTDKNDTFTFPEDGRGKVTVRYRVADSTTAETEYLTLSQVELSLQNGFSEDIIPGSLRFTVGGKTYVDRGGLLYTDINPLNDAGVYAGTIDYSGGLAVLTSWEGGAANTVTLESMATQIGRHVTSSIQFRIPVAPVRPQSLQLSAVPVDGSGPIDVTADAAGAIDSPDAQGWIDYATGVVSVQFGAYVDAAGNEGEPWYDPDLVDDDGKIFQPNAIFADTVRYNAVTQSFLPLDGDILGLDPVRLPQDGRIPVYAAGDVLVILHDDTVSDTYVSGQTVSVGRTRLSKVIVRDAAGNALDSALFTVDMEAGEVTFGDLTGVSQPITITHRVEDMAVCTDAQITGRLTLSQPVTHEFPVGETVVASAVIFGDLFARTTIPFGQQTWTGEWRDTQIGNDAGGEYNALMHPITVDNASAIQERWRITFTSSSTVNVTGEHVGQILTGADISQPIAPINPYTQQPYFTIAPDGWGGGWSTGNVLRFNTIAANAPLWIIQSVSQGEASSDDLSFTIEFRGDVDTP